MKNFSLLLLSALFSMCGIPSRDYNALQSANDSLSIIITSLNREIDELKNGEERLVNLIDNAYSSGKFILANKHIQTLLDKHPESDAVSRLKKLQEELLPKIAEEQAAIEKQRRDSIRLANIDNLGIWKVGYYVDDFGEPTKSAYVSTDIYGKFSNSATTNSDLRVRFLIDKSDIRIQLYEYARNHPVKGEGIIRFKIRDSDGNEFSISSYNDDSGNNTVSTHTKDDASLRGILLRGGSIKFVAVANRFGSPSEYNFTIQNADFLENALLKAGVISL